MNPLTKKILTWITVIGFITFVTIHTINRNSDDNYLRTNPSLTTAKIVNRNLDGKGRGNWIEYEFVIDNKTFGGSKKYYGLSQRDNYLMGKHFPVLYSKKDPSVNRLLILQNEFEEFDLIQPDSLKKYNDFLE